MSDYMELHLIDGRIIKGKYVDCGFKDAWWHIVTLTSSGRYEEHHYLNPPHIVSYREISKSEAVGDIG